jgi:hypothetical protein
MPIPQEKITLVGWASCPSHQSIEEKDFCKMSNGKPPENTVGGCMAFSILGRSHDRSFRYPTSGTCTSQTRKLLNFCELTDLLFYSLSEFV